MCRFVCLHARHLQPHPSHAGHHAEEAASRRGKSGEEEKEELNSMWFKNEKYHIY